MLAELGKTNKQRVVDISKTALVKYGIGVGPTKTLGELLRRDDSGKTNAEASKEQLKLIWDGRSLWTI